MDTKDCKNHGNFKKWTSLPCLLCRRRVYPKIDRNLL